MIASLGLLLPVVSTSNAQQGPALISGEVVNRTPGEEIPAGRLVVLHILMQDGNQDFKSASTDANGAFSFTDVPLAEVLGYLLVATHQGVDYTLEILPGEALTGLELEIFETTSSIDAVGIVLDSVMIADWDVPDRTLSVLELVQLENYGNETFVPDLAQPANMAFLRFALPSNARDLQVQTQLPEGQVLQVDRGFAVTTSGTAGSAWYGLHLHGAVSRRPSRFFKTVFAGRPGFPPPHTRKPRFSDQLRLEQRQQRPDWRHGFSSAASRGRSSRRDRRHSTG